MPVDDDEWAARFQIWKKAFGDLLETLNRASSEPTERGRYIVELTALATFVSTFNKPNGAHIFELASKLNDLNNGRDDPIFLPADVKDRPIRGANGGPGHTTWWRSKRSS